MTKKTPKTQVEFERTAARAPFTPNKKGTRLARQLAGIEGHLERHPNDGMSRARVSRIKDLMAGRG